MSNEHNLDTYISIIKIITAIILIKLIIILVYWFYQTKNPIDSVPDIASTLANLIVALVSMIAILNTIKYTRKSIEQTNTSIINNKEFNDKTLKLTNETLNQSEEIMYIQLRFDSAEKSLFNFENKLTDANIIYNELIAVTSEDYFFNARGYMIAQYTNWLFDLELLEHLPRGLINKLNAKFENIGNIYPVLDFEKYISSLNSFSGNDNKKCKRELRSHYEFNNFIQEFNKNCKSGRFIDKFKELYMSDLNEMEIITFIIQTRGELRKRSVEDFIYEEKLLKLDLRRMKREINENELEKQ